MPRPTDDGRGKTPTLIAHQGFADVYPGNTLAAMRGAASDGAAMIELDVQCCADGEVVVFHDPRLDESTDKGGRVTETPCEVVLDAEVRNSGETIPTLKAVLGEIPTDVGVNVELKKPVSPERTTGRAATDDARDGGERPTNERVARWLPLVEHTLEVLDKHNHPSLLLSSFHVPALAAVREIDTTVPVAPLFADATERAFTAARRYDAAAINPSIRCTTRELVDRAHGAGLAVNAYTVTRSAQAARLRRLGVDGVIADSASVLDV